MTDNELKKWNKEAEDRIIKALECCADCDEGCSTDCPLFHGDDSCFSTLLKPVLDLITRQKAEKEALIAGQETLQKHIAEQKAEIERLQGEIKEKTETIGFLKEQVVGWGKDYCELKSLYVDFKAEHVETIKAIKHYKRLL